MTGNGWPWPFEPTGLANSFPKVDLNLTLSWPPPALKKPTVFFGVVSIFLSDQGPKNFKFIFLNFLARQSHLRVAKERLMERNFPIPNKSV
jgi:hypothetical protein